MQRPLLTNTAIEQHSWLGNLLRRLHLDIPLLVGLGLIAGVSFLVLYSASGQDMQILVKQFARIGLAFVLMAALAHVDPQQFQRYSLALYTLGVILLIAVLIIGQMGKGAQRWLDLGVFRFQPSELLKITTPMMVAWYLSEHPLPPSGRSLFVAALIILVPALLIAKQPDLGTALLVISAGGAVIFFAGISWRILLALGFLAIAAMPVIWLFLHDYQRDRILTFLNPEADPMGRGYHIIQSKIAIGSGGIYGKGWLGSTQSQLDFLPESSTDFIFAVFAEEFGLFGCLGLLTLYLLVISRCLYIAAQAQGTYCRLLAGSFSFTFFVYVFVNVGMVIGLLPVVGVPLPLISYGGTSMVTLMAGFGILMSIHSHRKLLPA